MLQMVLVYLLVFLTILFLFYSVLTESKFIGSLIQLGELQIRQHEYSRIQDAKAAAEKKGATSILHQLSLSARLSFTIGLANVALTAFVLGAWPSKFLYLYTPKAIVLITARWIDFRQRDKPQHYLLLDFCYFANALV